MGVEDPGNWRGRLRSIAVVAALAVAAVVFIAGGPPALASKTPTLTHGNSKVSRACVSGKAYTVRARVGIKMTVTNGRSRGTWAERMETRARLESITPGLKYSPKWRSVKTAKLSPGKRYASTMRVLTDPVTANARWRLHVRLIWHRPAPTPDVTKDLYASFNGSCVK